MDKQKRKSIALKEKYELIQKIHSGVKQSDICKNMGFSKSTVGSIWKQRAIIESSINKMNSNVKKMKKSKHEEVDKGLLMWFSQKRHENVTITGDVLQEKANTIGRQIENSNFACSKSWIERFKKRHSIAAGKIVGESASVNMNTVNEWLTDVWPNIQQGYQAENIFNADETGLFYKLTPDKTLRFTGESCSGGKLSKDRITVLVAANMSGTEKRKLLIIGKSARPRSFKNKQLPVKYKFNNKAWMTSEIFTNELQDWDNELSQKTEKSYFW